MVGKLIHRIQIGAITALAFLFILGVSTPAYAEYDCGTYGAGDYGADCPANTTPSTTPTKSPSNTVNPDPTTQTEQTPEEATPIDTTSETPTKDTAEAAKNDSTNTPAIPLRILIGLGVILLLIAFAVFITYRSRTPRT